MAHHPPIKVRPHEAALSARFHRTLDRGRHCHGADRGRRAGDRQPERAAATVDRRVPDWRTRVIPDPDALLALVDATYEAAFEPSRWTVALPLLVRALNAEQGFLGFTSTLPGRTIASFAHEFDPEFLNQWQGEFGGSDPWYEKAGNLPTSKVVQGAQVLPFEDLR